MKEKIFRFRWLIIAVMVLAFVPKTVQAQATIEPVKPSLGDGSESNPYQIKTKENLYWFAEQVNIGNISISAKLTADIVVNENLLTEKLNEDGSVKDGQAVYNWTPIGTYYPGCTGTFDGQGYTVIGLYFNDGEKSNIGFFGFKKKGYIKNVGVVDSYFKGKDAVGGVCGYKEYDTMENCYSSGNVVCAVGTLCYVGGVCGSQWSGTIKNCYNYSSVVCTTDENAMIGGVCGYQDGSNVVENCYYLKDENNSKYPTKGIGRYDSDIAGNAEGKSLAEFGNGSVAWLLNENIEGTTPEKTSPWLQNLSTDGGDKFPVLKANTANNVCPIVVKDGDDNYKNGSHSYDNVTFADFPDEGTDNLYSRVCDHCKGAAQEDEKKIKELNCKDNDITITKEDNVWKTEAKITLGDDPTTNWYNAPVEFTTTGGVSYTRTMSDKNRWATVCLPYAVSATNDKCKFYELSGVETDKITLTEITDATTIAAGTPVFVKANDGVTEITFSATGETTMLTAPTAGSTIEGYTLTGVFNLTELSKVEENVGGDLFIKNDNMWNMSQPGNNMKVKIFHAYLKNNGSGTYAPKRSIAVDGEATAISDALDTLNDANVEYYDMSGRRINSLQKGVNIIRSGNKTRKVIIK